MVNTLGLSKLMVSIGLAAALMGANPAFARHVPARHAPAAKQAQGRAFIARAVQAHLANAQMGQLAQDRSRNEAVRGFGRQLADDDSAAGETAAMVARAVNVAPPAQPSPNQKARYLAVSRLSGAAFDRQFVNHIIMDHTREVVDYQKAANGKGAVPEYATETLSLIQRHLRSAQALLRSLK